MDSKTSPSFKVSVPKVSGPTSQTESQSAARALGMDSGLARVPAPKGGAPAIFDGPIDTLTFLAQVDQVLVPTLRRGDIVLDDLAVHK